MVRQLFILAFFIISSSITFGKDIELPNHLDPVIDMTNTLSQLERERINHTIRSFSDTSGSQIAVILISSTNDLTIEEVALDYAEAWRLGREGIDDGVLVLIAKNDRKIRIEVGYGLEGAIPDIYAKRIIENTIKPKFKSGNFGEGILEGVESLILLINEEELPGVVDVPEEEYSTIMEYWPYLVGGLAILLVGFFLMKGWWKNITHFSTASSFKGKLKYIFVRFKWSFLGYAGGLILLSLLFGFTNPVFGKGLLHGASFATVIFTIYFTIRGNV